MKKDLVSIVFPTINRKEDIIKCINSIKKSTHKKIEIIIADNGSTDGTQKTIKKVFFYIVLSLGGSISSINTSKLIEKLPKLLTGLCY